MLKVSAVTLMKKLASENFKLKDDVSFVDFESIDLEETSEAIKDVEDFSAHVEVDANMCISYEGEPPDSYRVLNGILQDWVDDNDERLKKIINPKLIPFLKDHFKNLDVSDLQEDFDDYIWEDQVDYMPDIDEDKKEIKFSIELVLDVEESDEDDE